MDRKTTIKTLREIIRNLKDENLFIEHDFFRHRREEGFDVYSRVDYYICKKLDYPLIVKFIKQNQDETI